MHNLIQLFSQVVDNSEGKSPCHNHATRQPEKKKCQSMVMLWKTVSDVNVTGKSDARPVK